MTPVPGWLRPALTLLGVYTAGFLLLHALPGDPADRLDTPGISAEAAERTRRALGLDRPPAVRYVTTLASYARGDLGVSFSRHRPVGEVLRGALPASLALGGVAIGAAYALSFLAALLCLRLAPRRRALVDRAALLVATVPRFWLGPLLILVFHAWLRLLPGSHAGPPGAAGGWPDPRHLLLPAAALAIPSAAALLRYQFAAMEEALAAPHTLCARAAGLAGFRLVARHVVRPHLGLLVTLAGLDLPALLSGALVVEVVFAWPGLGRIAAEAVLGGDYPLALASMLLAGAAVTAGAVAAGLLTRRLDPRLGRAAPHR